MGVKALKDHFDNYLIKRNDRGEITMGTPLYSEMAVVDKSLNLIKNDTSCTLHCFPTLMQDIKNGKIKQLIDKEDTGEKLIDVSTFKKGKVVKKQCEK